MVDTDDQRRRGGQASYVRHYGHIVAAVWGRQPVVIHSRGTLGTLRRLIALLSFLRGRPAHLILLDAPRAAAEDGQRRRGRRVSRRAHGPRGGALGAPAAAAASAARAGGR